MGEIDRWVINAAITLAHARQPRSINLSADVLDDRSSRHVVEAIVSLAHGFEVATAAEGIESAAILELLVTSA